MDASKAARARQLGPHAPSELEEGTVVVLPSISFPSEELRKIIGIQHYEERLLCLLLLLANPRLRMLYITSVRVAEPIVDYYLSFLDDPAGSADRLFVMSLSDESPRALTEKVLEHPYAARRIRELATESPPAYILPFNVTPLETRLGEITGVSLYGCHPSLVALGSKSGSRKVATRAGVPVLPGAEDIYSLTALHETLEELRRRQPGLEAAVVKLNEGFSGQGNAIVDIRALGPQVVDSPTTFCAAEESWATFGPKLEAGGAIAEALVREQGLQSPSVQMRILPDGSKEIISTHDQLLGGPDDQVYLGCRFPASERYRRMIQEHARNIAEVLGAEGVIGSFAMDFIVTAHGDVYLSEINLRMGGTTHPFLMTRFATRGHYEEATGRLVTDRGPRCYVATDNLKSRAYVGLDPSAVVDRVREQGLAFHRGTQSGILLHLLGALRGYGKLGATCVGESSAEAEELYRALVRLLGEMSSLASQDRASPRRG